MLSWDEEGLRRHESERGVAYGTQKIDQPDTPFLYPRDDTTNTVQEAVGHGRKQTWDEEELKHKLGLLAQKDAQQEPRFDTPKYTPDMVRSARHNQRLVARARFVKSSSPARSFATRRRTRPFSRSARKSTAARPKLPPQMRGFPTGGVPSSLARSHARSFTSTRAVARGCGTAPQRDHQCKCELNAMIRWLRHEGFE